MRTRTNRSDRAPARSSFNLSNWLLKTLNGSKIGLAIYDKGFHYVGVNSAIAIMNGVPPEEHLGQTAPEVIGRTARIIEARIDRVFLTGQPVYQHEFFAKLPMRADIGYWIQDYFPISEQGTRVSHVGIFVVEVTEQRRLEVMIRRLRKSICAGVSIDDGKKLRVLIWASKGQGTLGWPKMPQGVLCDPPSPAEPPLEVLSERELEVLSLLAQGQSNKEVALTLAISEKTVETYRSRIKLKLGLSSLVELVHYAIRHEIVKP
jgi:DNA-binding CsgD family transcriptional regulator